MAKAEKEDASKPPDTSLRHSEEERLRAISETSPVGITIVDRDGRIVFANPRAEQIFGLTKDQITQQTYNAPIWRISDENGESFADDQLPFRRVMATGQRVFDVRHAIEWPDGRRVLLSINAAPLFDAQGHVDGIVATLEDITERRRAEVELRESEIRLRTLSDNLPGGLVYQIDSGVDGQQRRFTYVSAGIERMHGVSAEEALKDAMIIYGQVLEEDRPWIVEREAFALTNLKPFTAEAHFRLPSGEIRWRLLTSAPRRLPNRHILWDGIEIDITERKRAEETILDRERYLCNILETTGDGFLVLDSQGFVIEVNQAYCVMSGYGRDELMGMNIVGDIDATHTPEEAQHRFQSVMEDGFILFETRLKRKDGSLFAVEVSATFMAEKGGQFICFCRDLTERKRVETEQEKLKEKLNQAQKMESVGRLAGGVAHDFNNMLGVILGHTEFALEQVDPGQPLFNSLQEIRKAADRSADLTRQLLAFASKQTVAPRVLDLNHTVEGMLKMLRRLIGEDIDLTWLPGKTLWPIRMDPSQIDQILANLFVNARDAIAGVGKIAIETSRVTFDDTYCAGHPGYAAGDFVLLAVRDNSCGMDKQTLDNLFEPFFTTKGVGKGTGLGLATVYGIVKQNNGFIQVCSKPGEGSTFMIYLPRHEGEAGSIQAESTPTIPHANGETVLIVEDETAILEMSKAMLEKLDYTVMAACTPSEALMLARAHSDKIHLLLTDVIMPEMNGQELARRLAALCPGIKVLFMSGYTADVITLHGVLDKEVHFIQKPFLTRDLAVKIREALQEH